MHESHACVFSDIKVVSILSSYLVSQSSKEKLNSGIFAELDGYFFFPEDIKGIKSSRKLV